jgi:hypothetical protein
LARATALLVPIVAGFLAAVLVLIAFSGWTEAWRAVWWTCAVLACLVAAVASLPLAHRFSALGLLFGLEVEFPTPPPGRLRLALGASSIADLQHELVTTARLEGGEEAVTSRLATASALGVLRALHVRGDEPIRVVGTVAVALCVALGVLVVVPDRADGPSTSLTAVGPTTAAPITTGGTAPVDELPPSSSLPATGEAGPGNRTSRDETAGATPPAPAPTPTPDAANAPGATEPGEPTTSERRQAEPATDFAPEEESSSAGVSVAGMPDVEPAPAPPVAEPAPVAEPPALVPSLVPLAPLAPLVPLRPVPLLPDGGVATPGAGDGVVTPPDADWSEGDGETEGEPGAAPATPAVPQDGDFEPPAITPEPQPEPATPPDVSEPPAATPEPKPEPVPATPPDGAQPDDGAPPATNTRATNAPTDTPNAPTDTPATNAPATNAPAA